MKIKVHWIVDGIAELDADSQEEAEKWVNEVLTQILNDNPIFSENWVQKQYKEKLTYLGTLKIKKFSNFIS